MSLSLSTDVKGFLVGFLTLIKGIVEVELMVTKCDNDRVNKEHSAFGRLEGRNLRF